MSWVQAGLSISADAPPGRAKVMQVRQLLLPALICLVAATMLAACAQQRPAGAYTPVVVEGRSQPPSSEASIGTAAEPALPPTAPRQPPRQLADGSQLPAVKGLLSAAGRALEKGDVDLAAADLERAQRLAPQSVTVYQRLATVRLKQKRPAEAEQLARKALALATTPAQQAGLWRLIASARQQQGKSAEAREASAKAASLEGGTLGGAP
jgi:predicted Zn-dependent protease